MRSSPRQVAVFVLKLNASLAY